MLMEQVISFRISYEEKEQFMKKCRERGENASELFRSWMRNYLISEVKEPINTEEKKDV